MDALARTERLVQDMINLIGDIQTAGLIMAEGIATFLD